MDIEDKIISAIHAYEALSGNYAKFSILWKTNLPDDNPFRIKTYDGEIEMFDGKKVIPSFQMLVGSDFSPIGKASFRLPDCISFWSFYIDIAGNLKETHDLKTIFHNVNHAYRFERVYSMFMAAYFATLVEVL